MTDTNRNAANIEIAPVVIVPLRKERRPLGLRWRSSIWFATLVAGCGVAVDLFVYAVIIPVIPFQLERLGYSATESSTLTGWLLFIYCAGIVLATPPAAMVSERTGSRQGVLVAGSIVMIGAQIMFMEAPAYWVMCIARALQGVSSTCIWVAGLALVCDVTPEELVGRQLGLAMSGMTVGMLAGPPLGGILYSKLGFRAPFVMGTIIVAVDLIGRFFIVERMDALEWGVDPWVSVRGLDDEKKKSASNVNLHSENEKGESSEVPNKERGADEERELAVPASSSDYSPEASTSFSTRPLPMPAAFINAAVIMEHGMEIEEVQRHTALATLQLVPSNQSSIANTTTPSGREAGDTTVISADLASAELTAPKLSSLAIVLKLCRSARAMVSLMCIFAYGAAYIAQEPTLPLHLQAVWGYDSTKVGLIYIGSVTPTFFSPILAGFYGDKIGPEWITCLCLLLSLPFWCLLIINKSIILFIAALILQSFFAAGVATVLTMELALVARKLDGVGYAHVYGAYNLVFGLGGVVGPVVGTQLYANVPDGWTAVCLLAVGLFVLSLFLSAFYMGDVSVVRQVVSWLEGRSTTPSGAEKDGEMEQEGVTGTV